MATSEDLTAALLDPFIPNAQGITPLYIPQMTSTDLDSLISNTLHELNRFQVRTHQKTPLKPKRRLVYGLRETLRAQQAGKLNFIIVATDLDPSFLEQEDWITLREANPTFIYGLKKRELGKAITGNPRVHIGIVGVLSADGAHDACKGILMRALGLRHTWNESMIQSRPAVPLVCIAAYFGHTQLYIVCSDKNGFLQSTGDTVGHIAAARGSLSILKLAVGNQDQSLEKNFSLETVMDVARKFSQMACITYLESLK